MSSQLQTCNRSRLVCPCSGAAVRTEASVDPDPMYESILLQLKSLPEWDQSQLVTKVHSRSKLLGALRNANPPCYDKVCQVARVAPNKVKGTTVRQQSKLNSCCAHVSSCGCMSKTLFCTNVLVSIPGGKQLIAQGKTAPYSLTILDMLHGLMPFPKSVQHAHLFTSQQSMISVLMIHTLAMSDDT